MSCIFFNTLPMHIAISGNIGAGKTTLTSLLGEKFGWEVQYESVEDNPYLDDFYRDMKRWSFNLQIFFLNSRFKQAMEVLNSGKPTLQDRTIYEDAYIFASNLHEMGLMTTRDFNNYLSIFESVTSLIAAPDLLIYLRASVPTLVKQIQIRGREYEKGIRIDYLEKLNNYYDKWIKSYTKGKLLIIDVDNIDFATKPEDFDKVVEMINKVHPMELKKSK
ncbi:MAG: deoxyadenosine/deoxycytidine kinase [Sphingobacteriales bacterium]